MINSVPAIPTPPYNMSVVIADGRVIVKYEYPLNANLVENNVDSPVCRYVTKGFPIL